MKSKCPKPFRVRSLKGDPVTITAGEQTREFYDITIVGLPGPGAKPETLLLRLDRAQMILLRSSLDALFPAVPGEPVPDKSAQH
jgi:hypothetical protein